MHSSARGPRPPGRRFVPRSLVAWTSAVLAGVAAFLAVARPDRPRLILLISLDTFRADLLDAKRGDGTALTPALGRLADESLRFENAMAFMPYTLPSHMTLFTGLHHETHYVVTEQHALGPEIETLGEVMRRAGYRTVGVYTSHFLRGAFGFDRGFDTWLEVPVDLTFADRVNEEALRAVDEAARTGERLFLFLHYFDPHSDFDFAENRLSYFSPPSDRSDLEIEEADLCDPAGNCATEFLLAADREARPVASDRVERIRRLYERGVLDLDTQLGRLFSELERRGLWRDALVVLLSDHGEEFREHGKFLHSQVYQESLRVPLLIRWPGRVEAGVDARLVGLDSVTRTMIRAAGGAPPVDCGGIDLLSAPAGSGGEPHVAQDKLKRSRYGYRSDDHLLVWDFASGQSELFDRSVDPDERVDLAARHPELVKQLQEELFASLRRLRAQRTSLARGKGVPFSEREIEVLRSLGYLR